MPDLRTVERFVGSVCRQKQDFTEAVDSETFLGRKGRADPLFVVANALWVAEKLPSVVTGDEFHGTGSGVCSALGAQSRTCCQMAPSHCSLSRRRLGTTRHFTWKKVF